jgi:lipopolysaccharide transport system permease protein
VEATTTVIRPRTGWNGLGLAELWRARELVLFFAWRQVLVRYKQTVLGVAWSVLQPLSLMAVMLVVITLAKRGGNHGAVWILAGIVPWQFFATAVSQSAGSLVGQIPLLTKIYFPRLIPPVASVIAALVDMAISFSLLLTVMAIFHDQVHVQPLALALLPLLALLAFVTALGIGLWLSALNVAYRDVQYLVPFLIQIGMFASVLFPASITSGTWYTVLGLNPMAGVVEGFRYAIVGGNSPSSLVVLSSVISLSLLVSGLAYFKRAERTFVDVI